MFWLALKTSFLTILTLGFYRFWMKTRLRRWYWSAIRVGGTPLEYTGTGVEKMLGFLIAVVFLAFYIGIVNLLLMFASFSLFEGNFAGYFLSFIGVIPFWFYAQYRARRYVLARTRWRGIRFGLEPGAWGYAFRALGYWVLMLVSAGLLLPLLTFRLEQYKAKRTFLGDARLVQRGAWTMLYRSMRWLFVAAGASIAAGLAFVSEAIGSGIGLSILAGLMFLLGIVYYRVDSLRRLTAHKEIVGSALKLEASTSRIVWIYIAGSFLTYLAFLVPLLLFGVVVGITIASGSAGEAADLFETASNLAEGNRWLVIGTTAILYFSAFLILAVLTHVMITTPTMRHYAETFSVQDAENLNVIRQRPRDEHTEAEGFAEALDVGASI